MSNVAFLQVGSRSVSLIPQPTEFSPADIVALCFSVALLVAYHTWLWHVSTTQMHRSLSSHVDFSRMSWTRFIFYDYKNKVTTVQTFRSALSVVNFYLTIIGTTAMTLLIPASRGWWAASSLSASSLRTILPATLLLASLTNIVLALLAYFYLHFHTQVEDVDEIELKKFGLDDAAHCSHAEQVKAATATLAMQCNRHFRFGWRLLVVSLVFMCWSISPYALLAASTIITWHLYVNDFPFSGKLGSQLRKGEELLLDRKRREISQVFQSLPQ